MGVVGIAEFQNVGLALCDFFEASKLSPLLNLQLCRKVQFCHRAPLHHIIIASDP